MKSLIIGAAGFVGDYLIQHLKKLGNMVVATKLPNESLNASGVSIRDLNILNPMAISALLAEEHPDHIYHLAAQSSISFSWKNPGLTIDVNVKGSLNVLDAVRQLDYKPRILLIGSGEEYGYLKPEEIPIKEETIVRPGNIYAATKVCQNMMGTLYSQAYHIDVILVRAFNHVGPKQAPMFVVSDFCKQVAEIELQKKEAVMKVGNLSAKREFTDVRDVVRAYSLLMEKGIPGETYNVGSGHAIEINELLSMILKQSRVPIEVTVDPDKLRPSDVPIIEADISKLKAATGWSPQISLEQTITDTLNYWRTHL